LLRSKKQQVQKHRLHLYPEPTFSWNCAPIAAASLSRKDWQTFSSVTVYDSEAIDFASELARRNKYRYKSVHGGFLQKTLQSQLQPFSDTVSYIANKTKIWMENHHPADSGGE